MPIYEYECDNGCGHAAEVIRKMSERSLALACRNCGGRMRLAPSRIAYPGFVDRRRAADAGRTPIFHHNGGGPR